MRWVNDSQATIPLAAIAALEAFDAPIVLIAGGKDKGLEYAAFADAIAARPRARAHRRDGDELEALIAGRVPVRRAGSMDEAVAGRGSPSPATSGCSRRRRPASTCSSTTRRAATPSAPRSRLEGRPMTAATIAVAARRGRARGGVRRERHEPAYALLLAVMALTAIGIVMVFGVERSLVHQQRRPGGQGLEQLVWAGIGLVGLIVAMRIDFRHLRYLAIPIFVITLALLVRVLIPDRCRDQRIAALDRDPRRRHPPAGRVREARGRPLPGPLARPRGKAAGSFWNGLVPFALLVAPGFFLIAAEPDLGDRRRLRHRRGQHLLHGRRQPALPRRDRRRRCSGPRG